MDALLNSYVTGFFADSATFGAGEVNETTLTSPGSPDIFLAKYNTDGLLLWVKQAGGSADDLRDRLPGDVRELPVSAAVAVAQPVVVETEQVEHRRVQVVR